MSMFLTDVKQFLLGKQNGQTSKNQILPIDDLWWLWNSFTGRLLVNRTIGRPIVRLSGSLGCAPSLMLSILYLNLTPDSFDGFLNRTSASNLTKSFSLNLTLAAASQGKYVACLFKSDSKVVPDSFK